MTPRFDPILKTAIATTVLLMFAVAIVSGQARNNLEQGAAGAPATTPTEVRIEHAIKHGPAAIVKGSIVKGIVFRDAIIPRGSPKTAANIMDGTARIRVAGR